MKYKSACLLLLTLVMLFISLEGRGQDGYTGRFTIAEEQFAIWNGREYIPLFIKGINMGISVPGTQPGQLAATREDYRRWFHLIREAGYNTIRIYTLHYPRFYEELSHFNLTHPADPLLVIQGIWLEEQETAADLFHLTPAFSREIREVVRAVHGDMTIPERFGKAFGAFTADISPWVAGYLIGREVFPAEVVLTNQGHPGETVYNGRYFSFPGDRDPVEVWVAQRLDSLVIFESDEYATVRPVGFSSWPTLDPLNHPTEQLLLGSQEDDEQIDLSTLVASGASGGFFVSYHAYPYYPDFIVQDPHYALESDSTGPNCYLGYLHDLKKHYEGIPLLIAEFGVPSSWGSGHLSPSGMHHGGLTEEAQGRFAIRMLDNIREAGCAGGIQFSLLDEWFKQTWITNPYSDRQYRHLWHNITSPEENFGILSFAPPPSPYTQSASFTGKAISGFRVASDYTFFRIRVYMDTERHAGDTLWIALDTYGSDLGESVLPDGTSIGGEADTLRAEFALGIPLAGDRADLYVIPSYDVYGIRTLVRPDTVVSARSDAGSWNRVRWKTNYYYHLTQYIGELRISGIDDPYQFLNAVTVFKDSLEIRIPWTLINFTAPNVRRVMHYLAYHDGNEVLVLQKDTLSDGIALTLSLENDRYQGDRYAWDFWDYEKILNDAPIERKKQSFHYLKQQLPLFNSDPIGLADTFHVWPEGYLIMEAGDGLMANDFDIDGNFMEVFLAHGSGAVNGSLYLHPDGGFSYTPDPGFRGEDFFMYYLDDGFSYSTLVPVTVRVGFPLAVEETAFPDAAKRFEIFPNPGKDVFHIKTPVPPDEAMVIISDLTGREIACRYLYETETLIRLADVTPGIYIFRIYADQTSETHRIIIY
ncbi:MAG TPA: T9SS type A sorting domain-containing protein [Bacteroides sp.]|nr:T9SS type A sorting domain-containing protein [Bacteroides sp.]